jgi:large subunit ribosomal protein L18
MDKKVSRLRRAVPTRRKINELRVHRLSVFRSNQHIYANIISPEGDRVLVSASTVEAEVSGRKGQGCRYRTGRFRSLGLSLPWPRESAGRCRA